ncbi:hypothetical protein [Flavobacterium macrobrachii]|uniref:Uncharacterized protein n=1 Tax=Flavobacterium macrobrachii TaxID=591204 RepID=A0ABS2CTU5_9FLAO|nr:hypothetical protein [Flavobacterium macrobrachii]MBM6497969.1 hypothetical protein [Flavobacterium macrobrachii]
MASLLEDIKKQSEWTVKAFEVDGYKLDYSIHSLIEIDRFFQKNVVNGKPKKGGRLIKDLGGIIFSISSYIAETIIQNVPKSELITNDDDPDGEINFTVKLPNGVYFFPAQRVMKRFKNGLEDAIYPYAYELTKPYVLNIFDQTFWEIGKEIEVKEKSKPWWRF